MYRKTIGKRMAAKLKQIRQKLRERLHEKTKGTMEWLQSVVRGYFQYHAVPDNQERMKGFRSEVLRLWFRQIRRRSQKSRWTWTRFLERLGARLPRSRFYTRGRMSGLPPDIRGKNRVR